MAWFAAVLAILMLAPAPARASGTSINAVAGSVVEVPTSTVLAGGSLTEGSLDSDTQIFVFREQLDRVLATDVVANITLSGVYGAALSPGLILAGTAVTSYLIHFDPSTAVAAPVLSGSIEFDQDVLGIIVVGAGLAATDAALGLAVPYWGNPNRGAEVGAALAPDQVTFTSPRSIALTLNGAGGGVDEIRVLVRADGPGVSFSIDWQSASFGTPAAFGGIFKAGEILTVGNGGAPGPNPPAPFPLAPGIMVWAYELGIAATASGVREVDAISFGRDSGSRLRFSVDEWAGGAPGGVAPDVRSEGGINQQAAADLFGYRAPFAPADHTMVFGNRRTHDGSGGPGLKAFGLVEPNAWAAGTPDAGDNLDAIDLGTTPSDIDGYVYFSLEGSILDPAEGVAGSGTAAANGVSAADILINRRAVFPDPPTAPAIYATYSELGLQAGDDIDALLVNHCNGAGQDEGQMPDYTGSAAHVYFSLRRGSPSLMNPLVLDSRYHLMLTEADVLEATPSGPAIYVAGEAMGLLTARVAGGYLSGYADELDGIDLMYPSDAPIGGPDQAAVVAGGEVMIQVTANDVAAPGRTLDRRSIRIVRQPQHGTLGFFDITFALDLLYRHDGSAGSKDSFAYIVCDDQGESSEPIVVEIEVLSTTGVESETGPARIQLAIVGSQPSWGDTRFTYSMPRAGRAELAIFDAAGRRVRTLLDGEVAGGTSHGATWDGRDASGQSSGAGLFFARLITPDGLRTVRVVRLQ